MTISVRIPDGKVQDFLQREAEKRTCQPWQVALALVTCVANSDLAEGVLDGFDPAKIGAVASSGLQVRILRCLPAFKVPNGTFLASFRQIADYLGLNTRGQVSNAIQALVRKGMIEIVIHGRQGEPSRYRLTERAELFLKEIGGQVGEHRPL